MYNKVKYKKWNKGEPNNAKRRGVDEDCVQMYGSGSGAKRWNDLWCTDKLAYVCELPEGKNESQILVIDKT